MSVFDERWKLYVPGKEPLRTEQRTNKLNLHITESQEIEPEPRKWEASAMFLTIFRRPFI